MDKLLVSGGAKLKGIVRISGAKNSALVLLAASIVAQGRVILENIPRISDVMVQIKILEELGMEVVWIDDNTVQIEKKGELIPVVPYSLAKKLRASNLFLGALIARCQLANVPIPGGCNLGSRPMDLHLKGMRQLGAKVDFEEGFIKAEAGEMIGTKVYMDFPSVGATENIMLAALAAKGTTEIENAAKEPEIVDLANFLNAMGAKVRGAGTDVIRIKGGHSLTGSRHTCIPDRIEAGTFMIAAVITGGAIRVDAVIPDHLHAVTAKLRELGAKVELGDSWIDVFSTGEYRPVDIKTLPYPGFPTDLQSPIMSLLTVVAGNSTIVENVFDKRFSVVDELKRMGAKIRVEGRAAIVQGEVPLTGAQVKCHDLRGGAGLVLAGLKAYGETEICQTAYIERGYENIVEKFKDLGANMKRV